MAELVDAADSKSVSSDRVPVQVRMGAPFKYNDFVKSFFLSIFVNLFLSSGIHIEK